MTGYAQWMDGKYASAVREIALATRQCQCQWAWNTSPHPRMGKGAFMLGIPALKPCLEAFGFCSMALPIKKLTSGAHYHLIRTMCASSWLRQLWSPWLESANAETVLNAIKLFPIRVINSGSRQAVAFLRGLTLPVPAWISAFAYELEAARNAFTLHIKAAIRPRLEVEFRNRHFFAVEAVEGIVMQLFLLEVRKRCVAPSILWLHDGFWIDKSVDDAILMAAERHVRLLLFPHDSGGDPLFRIVDLTESRSQALCSCPVSPFPPLFPPSPCTTKRSRRPSHCLTRQHPVARFAHKRGHKRKIFTYFNRVCKRARQFWLGR